MKQFLSIDWTLVGPVIMLVTISMSLLYSVNIVYFKAQLFSLFISLIVFFILSQINFTELKLFSYPIYIFSLIMLVIVLLIGIESHGAVRWISLFGTQLQISEILKPLLALSFAGYLSRKSEPSVFIFFSAIIFLVPVVILLYKQPDLGNAVIYATVAFFVLIVTGFPLRWFGAVLLPVLISLPVIWNFLHEYQRQRIITFIHPTVDPLGASYNGIQAVIAVGSGSYLGKGFFEGTQAALMFLPERHTDFIFATLSEDLGFIGAFLLIALFLFLCYRIYIVCMDSDSQFGKIFAATCFAFLFIQFVVNVGMNIGIIPIVGVTLPFVSYGGSSLLSNFIFLGLLVSLRRCAKAKEVLEIR